MQGELDSGILPEAEARSRMDLRRDEYEKMLSLIKVRSEIHRFSHFSCPFSILG